MEQTYDIGRTYDANYETGPKFASAPPAVPAGPRKSFLGRSVRSRIGIAAGLLLNRKWIGGYARRGFDLLTYKTVRSSYRPCYELPNWVFVEEAQDEPGTFRIAEELPADPADLSSSVCFGMPSMGPEVWREDVRRAKSELSDGQLLIVSVVATPEKDWTVEMLAADFALCAGWAVGAGADVIEANFSCPNVCSSEGSIYRDPVTSRTVCEAIREAIGDTPLLIKTGHFETDRELAVYLKALHGVANGVTMVNCIIGKVVRGDGQAAFGDQFVEAGILGRAIHDPCVESVRQAVEIIGREKLDLTVAAVGGAAREEDVARYFAAGSDAVLFGSAPMYLPNLAAELKRAHPEW